MGPRIESMYLFLIENGDVIPAIAMWSFALRVHQPFCCGGRIPNDDISGDEFVVGSQHDREDVRLCRFRWLWLNHPGDLKQKWEPKRVWEGEPSMGEGMKWGLMFVFAVGWGKLWLYCDSTGFWNWWEDIAENCFYTSIIVNIHVAYPHCRCNVQCLDDGAGNHERFGFCLVLKFMY